MFAYQKMGFQTGAADAVLYSFSSFTFTTGNRTGATGGTLAQFKSSYNTSTYPWLNDTSLYNVTTNGFQRWTVPETKTYNFVVTGAGGGNGGAYMNSNTRPGFGAILSFSRNFSSGTILSISVGHPGISGNSSSTCGGGSGGGGGGTWIYDETNSLLIAVAGGGGGAGNDNTAGTYYAPNAPNSTSGGTAESDGNPSFVPGGTNGNGGTTPNTLYGCVNGGGGGGGYLNAGGAYQGSNSGTGGNGYLTATNPLKGADSFYRDGGFGGGGGSGNYCGGGGGGYSGGAGGGLSSCYCSALSGGGGGGSFFITGLGNVTFSNQSSYVQAGSVAVTT